MSQLDVRTAPGIAPHIVAGPGVPDAARECAAVMVGRLVVAVARPVRYAQVVLTLDEDPAHERSALVEVSLDVVGAPVRAFVAAADLGQAIDRVGAVLLRRVHLQREWATTRLYASGGGPPRPAVDGRTPAAHPALTPPADRPARTGTDRPVPARRPAPTRPRPTGPR